MSSECMFEVKAVDLNLNVKSYCLEEKTFDSHGPKSLFSCQSKNMAEQSLFIIPFTVTVS